MPAAAGAKPVGRSDMAAGRDVRGALEGVGDGGMTHRTGWPARAFSRICLPLSSMDAAVTS